MTQIKTGQIVSIRNRLWRIDSIYKSELTATSVDSIYNTQKRFYIPLEKIEPTKIDFPPVDRVGELSKQQLLINAYRISLIHGTSPLMSLQLSRVVPTNFQLVPVVMALNSPSVRLLIADDVGLGKTIEAGLIMNELIARNMARKILIICPANLREQWQETLLYFFNIEFRIISSLHKRYLEKELPIGLSPWDYFQKLITSVDYAKAKANKNEILNYDWDLVVIDEAHLCSKPHTETQSQAVSMQRHALLKQVAQKAKHLLLLTATPHNGHTDSFASLIDALDIDATDSKRLNSIDKAKAHKHVCQRRRCDVVEWLKKEGSGFNPFPERDAKEEYVRALSTSELEIYSRLKNYSNEMRKLTTSSSLHYAVQFTILHFLKRALSSPQALRISLQNRINKLKENISSKETEEEISESDALTFITESDNLENFSTEEAHRRIEKTTFGESVTKYEITALDRILTEAKKIRSASDSKYTKLIKNTLPELFAFSNKVIIFTRYKDTLDYLDTNLKKDFSDREIIIIHGDIKSEHRKEIFKRFEESEKAILIATDCISEGMNLQYLCSQVIHYELPWNPNRLEQRNGRVDRFGQPEDVVHIRTMIVQGTLDEDILERIIERADRIKAEFGFSPPFFNDEKDILNRLVKIGKTPRTRRRRGEDPSQLTFFDVFDDAKPTEKVEDVEKVEDEEKADDEYIRAKLEQIKSDSFYGQTDIRLPDIERKLRETESTIGSRKEIETFIISGLKLFNCDIKQKNKDVCTITLSDKRLYLTGFGDKVNNATFDRNYAARHPGAELLDLSHPLVSRLVQLFKQQMYIDDNKYGRVAYKISAAIEKPIAIFKVLVRYVVKTEQSSVLEEIITIGVNIFEDVIVPSEKLSEFELSDPCPGHRTPSEVKEDLSEAYKNKHWEPDLIRRIEENRKKMIQEREHLIKTLNYKELPSWLKGITNIEYASHDVITVTLGYPK